MPRWAAKRAPSLFLAVAALAGLLAAAAGETDTPPAPADAGPTSTAPQAPAANPTPAAKPERVRAALIPISGEIDDTLKTSVARRAGEAVRDGCQLLIFHITSNGGYLDAGMELSRAIERVAQGGVRTIAFVDSKAYSAAAIAALSCQEIVMAPEASIGDCAPIAVSPVGGLQPMEGTEREKMESAVRERMESLALKNGYPPALAKAMVTQRIVVIEAVNRKSGGVRYVEEEDLFQLGPEWEKGAIVDSSTELLTVGSEKARKFGLARHIAARLDNLYDLYPIAGRIATYPVTWNESVVVWLNNMWLKSLLVLIGLLGIYIELNHPGFGVPGIVGLVAFGLLFAASFLAGEPDWLPPLVFLVGAVIVGIEIFVTPGFGFLGAVGVVLIVASIVLALSRLSGLPQHDYQWSDLYSSLAATAGVLAAFGVLAVVLGKFFPHVPILGRLVLAPGTGSDGSSRAAAARQESAASVGDVGRTVSKLRPAGKARIGNRLVDVVTEGDFLAAGADVRVIDVRGNRIVVRAAEPEKKA